MMIIIDSISKHITVNRCTSS